MDIKDTDAWKADSANRATFNYLVSFPFEGAIDGVAWGPTLGIGVSRNEWKYQRDVVGVNYVEGSYTAFVCEFLGGLYFEPHANIRCETFAFVGQGSFKKKYQVSGASYSQYSKTSFSSEGSGSYTEAGLRAGLVVSVMEDMQVSLATGYLVGFGTARVSDSLTVGSVQYSFVNNERVGMRGSFALIGIGCGF